MNKVLYLYIISQKANVILIIIWRDEFCEKLS